VRKENDNRWIGNQGGFMLHRLWILILVIFYLLVQLVRLLA
jgi:hypothetical protein